MEIVNHEAYVSLEVAKLLKEAGFDWTTRYSYDLYLYSTEGEKRVIDGFASTFFCNEHNGLASMPSLEVAQRWLREVKGIEVNVLCVYINHIKKYSYTVFEEEYNHEFIDEGFDTFEEAQEAGEKKALELILEERE